MIAISATSPNTTPTGIFHDPDPERKIYCTVKNSHFKIMDVAAILKHYNVITYKQYTS